MIKLTRLNKHPLYVNLAAIEYLESTPDTAVVFLNGDRILVSESVDEVVERATDHERRVRTGLAARGGS